MSKYVENEMRERGWRESEGGEGRGRERESERGERESGRAGERKRECKYMKYMYFKRTKYIWNKNS